MLTFVIFEVTLLLGRLQILSVVDLVNVDLAEFLQVREQVLNELDTFFGSR